MPIDRTLGSQNYGHYFDWPMTPSAREENGLSVSNQHLIAEDTPLLFGTEQAVQENPFYDHIPDLLETTNSIAHAQSAHDFNFVSWAPSYLQPIPGTSSNRNPYAALDERHGYQNPISSNAPAYGCSQDAACSDSHVTFNHTSAWWLGSSYRQPLFPLVDQENNAASHHFFDQSITSPFSMCPPPMTHAPCSNTPTVSTACNQNSSHPHLSTNSNPSWYDPSPTSTRSEIHPGRHLSVHRVPHRNSAISSHRSRTARAIEYDGLWIDEEEVLKGLTEPDGQLVFHRCQWDKDRSPCHLWIRGDKSCLKTHIQKWHGEQPGGDKHQVGCRWSACGKTMLKESVARHIVSIHLDEVWECQGCGKEIARNDAYGRHAAKSNIEACRTLGALITYAAGARVINARAALDSGGRVRYAGA